MEKEKDILFNNNLYYVSMTKEMFNLFSRKSQLFPCRHSKQSGYIKCNCSYNFWGLGFKRKKDAIQFALHANCIATAHFNNGLVYSVNLLFEL